MGGSGRPECGVLDGPDPRDAQHSACRASLQIEFNGYEVHTLCTITAPPPALVPVLLGSSVCFENLNALLKSIAHEKGPTAVAKSHRRESSGPLLSLVVVTMEHRAKLEEKD